MIKFTIDLDLVELLKPLIPYTLIEPSSNPTTNSRETDPWGVLEGEEERDRIRFCIPSSNTSTNLRETDPWGVLEGEEDENRTRIHVWARYSEKGKRDDFTF
jgi:hypothetical protein